MTTFTRRRTPKSPLDRYVLAPVHPDVRARYEALFTSITGVEVQWIPTGVVCLKCQGSGRIEVPVHRQRPGVHHPRDPAYRTYELHCRECWEGSGAVPCRICEERPATIRLDPDGEDFAICEWGDCWEGARMQFDDSDDADVVGRERDAAALVEGQVAR